MTNLSEEFENSPIMQEIRAKGCDYPNPSVYQSRSGFICRCIVCGRCGHHTGNTTQGHFWAFCDVTKTFRDFHRCCPGDCELESQDVK